MHNKELTSATILRTNIYKDYTKFNLVKISYFDWGVIDLYKDTLLSGKTLFFNEVITILTEAM